MRTDLFSCKLCIQDRFKLKGLILHTQTFHYDLVTISEEGEIVWAGMQPGEWGLVGNGYRELCDIRNKQCPTCNFVMTKQIYYGDAWFRCPNGDTEGYNAIEVQLRNISGINTIVYRRRPESLEK